ncbi:MAG: hypothetical protein CMO81_01190 [Waddliaceae bacterium]|nr:hypothetical protein [Waddliaceae bacterium]
MNERSHTKMFDLRTLELLEHAIKLSISQNKLDDSEGSQVLPFLAIFIALELHLKRLLCDEHWSLVCSKPGKVSKIQFDSGEFRSCSFDDALERLGAIGIDLSTLEKVLTRCQKTRNRAIHFHHSVSRMQVAEVFHILERLVEVTRSDLFDAYDDRYGVMREQIREWDELLKTRWAQVKKGLLAQEIYFDCLVCGYPAVLLHDGEDGLTCSLCYSQFDRAEYVDCGYNYGPGDYDPGPDCPHCGRSACLANYGEGVLLCVYCTSVSGTETCDRCGEVDADPETGLCSGCLEDLIGD